MAKAKSVAVEAKSDPQPGAESPAPEVKNTNGATIRRPKKGAAQKVSVELPEPVEPVEDSPESVGPEDDDAETETTEDGEPEAAKDDAPKPVSRAEARKALYAKGLPLFEYQPKDGVSDPIYLPLEFDRPDKIWLWELNVQPFLSQTWAWMDRAKVPRAIQRQCVSLSDPEYMDMFGKWFEAMGGGATPGE